MQEEGIERVNNCFDTITSDTLGGSGQYYFIITYLPHSCRWSMRRVREKGVVYSKVGLCMS